jgi:hypothetical protein
LLLDVDEEVEESSVDEYDGIEGVVVVGAGVELVLVPELKVEDEDVVDWDVGLVSDLPG